MATRRPLVLVLAAFASMGAEYRTTNFVVDAPTPEIAKQIGQYAEHYRKEKAIQWLGQEMPPWRHPCPLKVIVTMSGAGGATSFAFDHGQVLGQHMQIEGTLDRLVASVLPHEVTHTVFAYYYRCPVPRWADEGGSVLSEDEAERNRHDQLARQILNTPGRAIPLRRLFTLREYPNDVMALYAQGYSVTNFLVGQSNRKTFLSFVAHGMRQGWDGAVQSYYRYQNVDDLEKAWVEHLRNTKRPPAQLARNTAPADVDPAKRVVVRQTVPPAQPLQEPQPIVRGVAADPDDGAGEARRPAAPRHGYLPDYKPEPPPAPVRLGAPQFTAPQPPAQLGRPVPNAPR